MANLTNNEEIAVVAGISTIGLTATYLSTQTAVPASIRIPLVAILGLVAFIGGTFWALYVNAATPASVALPPQVINSQQPSVNAVPTSTQIASSDAQAATKS